VIGNGKNVLRTKQSPEIIKLIKLAKLPTQIPTDAAHISVAQFMKLMAGDKKVLDGQLHLVLMKALGRSIITAEFDRTKLEQTLEVFATQ